MEAARVPHFLAARSAGVPGTRGRPFFIVASFAVALLMTVASLGGILLPATYSQESVNWAAQAVGQDWVDLLIAVPWLAITATLVLNGSRRSLFLLAGGLLYTLYEFIYGLAVHFNSLFLVYCAVLGLAFFALMGVAIRLERDDQPRSQASAPAKTAGTFLLVIAMLFGALWLSDIVPALARERSRARSSKHRCRPTPSMSWIWLSFCPCTYGRGRRFCCVDGSASCWPQFCSRSTLSWRFRSPA